MSQPVDSHLKVSNTQWKLLHNVLAQHINDQYDKLTSTNASAREWQDYSDAEALMTTIDFIILQNGTRKL